MFNTSIINMDDGPLVQLKESPSVWIQRLMSIVPMNPEHWIDSRRIPPFNNASLFNKLAAIGKEMIGDTVPGLIVPDAPNQQRIDNGVVAYVLGFTRNESIVTTGSVPFNIMSISNVINNAMLRDYTNHPSVANVLGGPLWFLHSIKEFMNVLTQEMVIMDHCAIIIDQSPILQQGYSKKFWYLEGFVHSLKLALSFGSVGTSITIFAQRQFDEILMNPDGGDGGSGGNTFMHIRRLSEFIQRYMQRRDTGDIVFYSDKIPPWTPYCISLQNVWRKKAMGNFFPFITVGEKVLFYWWREMLKELGILSEQSSSICDNLYGIPLEIYDSKYGSNLDPTKCVESNVRLIDGTFIGQSNFIVHKCPPMEVKVSNNAVEGVYKQLLERDGGIALHIMTNGGALLSVCSDWITKGWEWSSVPELIQTLGVDWPGREIAFITRMYTASESFPKPRFLFPVMNMMYYPNQIDFVETMRNEMECDQKVYRINGFQGTIWQMRTCPIAQLHFMRKLLYGMPDRSALLGHLYSDYGEIAIRQQTWIPSIRKDVHEISHSSIQFIMEINTVMAQMIYSSYKSELFVSQQSLRLEDKTKMQMNESDFNILVKVWSMLDIPYTENMYIFKSPDGKYMRFERLWYHLFKESIHSQLFKLFQIMISSNPILWIRSVVHIYLYGFSISNLPTEPSEWTEWDCICEIMIESGWDFKSRLDILPTHPRSRYNLYDMPILDLSDGPYLLDVRLDFWEQICDRAEVGDDIRKRIMDVCRQRPLTKTSDLFIRDFHRHHRPNFIRIWPDSANVPSSKWTIEEYDRFPWLPPRMDSDIKADDSDSVNSEWKTHNVPRVNYDMIQPIEPNRELKETVELKLDMDELNYDFTLV
jgi:hypothetical protein